MAFSRGFILCLPVTLITFGACGDDGVGDSEVSTSSATTGSDSSSSGSSTTGVPFEPYAARGLTITRVEVNPGVAVPIGLDGGEVGGDGRNAFVIRDRDTLLRVYVDVADDWASREIEARLTLIQEDGTEEEFRDVFEITEDTREGKLASGPYFGIEAESMRPGVKYRVSLWETSWGYEELAEPDPAPMLPVDGSAAYVGVEDSYLNMRVVLVPVEYSNGSCSATVDAEAILPAFDDALYQQNPLSSLDIEVHAPYKVTYDMSSFSGLNQLVNEMSQLRAAEGAGPEVYYYGIFDNCGKCIGGDGPGGGCTVGLAASITGGSESDAWARAAAGQLNGGAAATFVHEIGHTQGRRHIYCSGAGTQAAGVDPSYPYDGGKINIWGFGVRDFGLRHPTATADYMSYCTQTWCSDWQWNATYSRIKTLSSWEGEDAGAVAEQPGLLIGAIAPDGSEDWWTVPGSLAPDLDRSAQHRVRFSAAGEIVDAAAVVSVRPHYGTVNVVVPLPQDFDVEVGVIRYLHGDDERTVDLDSDKIFHRPDHLRAR
ncbi:MAG TPA: hypothetical protein ENJ18_18250 [Nannocystis exedens]|nr:hypothetical protein [Nannocystis exedens]